MSALLLSGESPTTTTRTKAVDFFISYTRRDLAWAQWLAQTLESQGYTTRYQDRDFAIGTNFVAEMHDGVVDAKGVIAVLSPEYVTSPYCRDEWTAADLAQSTALVPVRVVDFTVEGLLGTRAFVDFVGLDESGAQQTLIDKVGRVESIGASGRETPAADLGRAPHAYPVQLHRVPAAAAPLLGRDDYLNRIEEGLEERTGPVVIVPDAAGLTGRGCTALAADYVRSRGQSYESVFWIHGRPTSLLPLGYWRVGRQLGLPPQLRTRDGVTELLEQKARRGRVLLVIDDAPDRGELFAWLPSHDVECIITSNSGSYYGELNVIPLGTLSFDEARSALVTPADQPDQAAVALLERVGNDPQSVALIAAYLRAVPGSPAELTARIDGCLAQANLTVQDALKRVVLATLEEICPPASMLLALLSFAAPRPVPLACLESAASTGMPQLDRVVQSPETNQLALVALTRLGLAHQVMDTLSIATWAGRRARDGLGPDERDGCHAAAVRLFTSALRDARSRADDDTADQLVAHLHVARHDMASPLNAATALDADGELGRHLSAARLHDQALAVMAEGLQRARRDDVSPEQLVRVLRDAAAAHEAAGMRLQAIEDLTSARAAAATLGARTAVPVLVQVGRLLARDDEADRAASTFDEAAGLIDAAEGDHTLEQLELDEARTEAARLKGDLEAALRIADDRFALASRWQGPDGFHAIQALIDRGWLHRRRGDHRDASTALEGAIRHLEKKAEDEMLAAALVEHAAALVSVNELEDAKLELGRAAVIYAERRGRRSDEIRHIRRHLADIHDAQGDAERAYELRRLAGDPQDPQVVVQSDTLRKLDRLRGQDITPVLGPGIATRLFTSRESIAESWAAEYPMEQHWHRSLPEIAQYRTIRESDEQVRLDLKAHIAGDLLSRYGPALPHKVRGLEPREPSTLEEVLRAVGAVERLCDPFEHHAVLASLPASIYISAGASDLLRDALVDQGKEPRVAVCDWRSQRVNKGAPEAAFHYQPTPERPLVLHIFGHLRERGSVVLTESDHIRFAIEIARGTPRGRVVPHTVVNAMAAGTLLILGFELQSWEFHVLFQALIDQPGSFPSDLSESVAVNVADESAWIDPSRAREYVQGYFTHRRVEVLWDDLDSVVKRLRSLWPGEVAA